LLIVVFIYLSSFEDTAKIRNVFELAKYFRKKFEKNFQESFGRNPPVFRGKQFQ
jgi:hypothetical protein